MAAVDSQLSDQQARDRIGWAAGADATRDSTRIDSARRETIITDDLSVIVDHHDTGEILALVGARERPQPVIERGFAAFEALEIRSEEHTSDIQSLMRNSYAVFSLK